MFSFKCDKCDNGHFVLNTFLTSENLAQKLSLLINTDGSLNINDVTDDVVMACQICGATTIGTFSQVVHALKISIVEAVLQSRQLRAYRELNPEKLKEENGVSYCGLCEGPFGEDGYCYNDIKSQCIIRKAYDKKNK